MSDTATDKMAYLCKSARNVAPHLPLSKDLLLAMSGALTAISVERDALKAENSRLRTVVEELRDADPKRYDGRQSEDPQDWTDDAVDAVLFDALQEMARAALEGLSDD